MSTEKVPTQCSAVKGKFVSSAAKKAPFKVYCIMPMKFATQGISTN